MTTRILCRWRQICLIAILLVTTGSLCLAQTDRGSITGTVADSGDSVISGAVVTATNEGTGTQSKTITTSAGYYTIPELAAGNYSITAQANGFSKLIRNGITVDVNVTARVDLALAVGSIADTVTVNADAPLLKTESAENNVTITTEDFTELPLNMAGIGAIRDPLSFAELAPGTTVGGWNDIHINGAPGATYRIILDGQDSDNGLFSQASDELQPSVEALQEFTLQADSFPAEFGQTTGGIFNYTTKSGANRFHGAGYEYFANEALNAGLPFSEVNGVKQKPRVRQSDFGGSIGGPIWIPKIYNGHDRTFFFFNYEMYRDAVISNNGLQTVPTAAYRNGDLSYLLQNTRQIGTDPLGRPIMNGAIYDPATTRLAPNGQLVRDAFPNNYINPNSFDPVAAKILALIPTPTNGNATGNYPVIFPAGKFQYIPSIKIDHNITSGLHIAGYYATQSTNKDNGGDGLPDPISARRYQTIMSRTVRINADDVLTPTLVLHAGIGFQRYHNPDTTPLTSFDQNASLGLPGAIVTGFPRINNLNINGAGLSFGVGSYGLYVLNKPTAVASVSWLKGQHDFKVGGEWRYESFLNQSKQPGVGNHDFEAEQTGLPSVNGQNLGGGSIGNGFASFVLGQENSTSIGAVQNPWWVRTSGAVYAEDTWKLTRKLTLTYGMRYDMQQKQHELDYKTTEFSPTTANPSAGGLLGGARFEGNGTGRCGCVFENYYPLAFGPRIGANYQIDAKTVVHAGFGVFFGQQPTFNYVGVSGTGFGWNMLYNNKPGYGLAAGTLKNGIAHTDAQLYGTHFDPGFSSGFGSSPGNWIYGNNGRPPRTTQTNVGIQRAIRQDMTLEAAYVGVLGAWFQANGLFNPTQLTQQRLSNSGLSLANADDRALLATSLSDPAVSSRFPLPYANYPTSVSLAQSLRPFPQYYGVGISGANIGNYWYNSLQMRLTKRLSHGIWLLSSYTWSKDLGTVNDAWGDSVAVGDASLSPKSQKTLVGADTPQILSISYRYEVPTFSFAANGWKALLLKGWTTDGILHYQSGAIIQGPSSQSGLTGITFASNNFDNRVAGQKLFTQDLNKHNFNPRTTLLLNPAAWAEPAPGTYGVSKPFSSDYRGPRYPSEQMGIGKTVNISERVKMAIRADFFNVFNRWALPGVGGTGNPQQTTQTGSNGSITNGFGYIGDGLSGAGNNYPPRTGQLVARIQF